MTTPALELSDVRKVYPMGDEEVVALRREAEVVIDARGARPAGRDAGDPAPAQTAYGVVVPAADPADVPRLAVAAFGLQGTNHWGIPADDADDPVSTATLWAQSPRAPVPVSLRARGDTTNRGRASPVPDRTREQQAIRRRRAREVEAARRVDTELLLGGEVDGETAGEVDGRTVSAAALARLQQLVGGTLHRMGVHGTRHARSDGAVRCTVERTPGHDTRVSSPEGTLTLRNLRVTVSPADEGHADVG